MKVTLERLPESRVSLDIEVEQDRVEQSLDVAYKRLAPQVRVPGFRPGKAPRNMIERQIGRQRLMSEALDDLVPKVYNEAIETEDVDAIGQPELESMELEPVRLKFTVPVRPTVDPGDYLAVRVEKKAVEITDEQVQDQVDAIRRRYAVHAPVERAAQWDDILIADVKGEVDGDSFVEDENAEFPLRKEVTLLVAGLAEGFVGMKKGEEKTVELEIPEDFQVERLQGKKANFTLYIREVKEEQLPEEDDELANQVNAEDFPTFEVLKERIRENLTEQAQRDVDTQFESEVIEKMVEGATIEYPKVLVEHEIDHLTEQSTGGDKQAYATYLQRIGRSEADFRESLRETAEARVKRSLVLSHIAEAEGLEVSEDEITAEIDSIAEPMGDDAERFKEMFSSPEGNSSIRRNLLNKKLSERLAAIAAGDAKEVPA
ncbi:MAG: trigger factor [Dehalococcoidia bacterium]